MSQPQTIAEKFIYHIQENYNKDQPWLNLRPVYSNHKSSGKWVSSLIRKGQYDGVRVPGIESVTTDCLRQLASKLYGVSLYKIDDYAREVLANTMNYEMGTQLNNEVNRIMSPFAGIKAGNEKTKEYVDWRSGEVKLSKEGQSFALAPQPFKMVDGSIRKGFSGCFDFIVDGKEIIELKIIQNPEELFKPVSAKVKGQVAGYLKANKQAAGAWVIYVSGDLSMLNWKDSATYRTYYMSREDAAKEWNGSIHEKLKIVIPALNAVEGDPSKFYSFVDSLPECSDLMCCGLARRFRENYDIKSDWTISPK